MLSLPAPRIHAYDLVTTMRLFYTPGLVSHIYSISARAFISVLGDYCSVPEMLPVLPVARLVLNLNLILLEI